MLYSTKIREIQIKQWDSQFLPLSMWQQQLKRQINIQSKVPWWMGEYAENHWREYKNCKDVGKIVWYPLFNFQMRISFEPVIPLPFHCTREMSTWNLKRHVVGYCRFFVFFCFCIRNNLNYIGSKMSKQIIPYPFYHEQMRR